MKTLIVGCCLLLLPGCGDPAVQTDRDVAERAPEEKPKTKKKRGLLNPEMIQDIGEYDPAAGRKVSDSKGRYSNPITGPLEMYGPTLERISKMHIQQALEQYRALNGEYPKDYNEFMDNIIRPNNIKLPKLPGGHEYQYDAKNHKLIVVEKQQ